MDSLQELPRKVQQISELREILLSRFIPPFPLSLLTDCSITDIVILHAPLAYKIQLLTCYVQVFINIYSNSSINSFCPVDKALALPSDNFLSIFPPSHPLLPSSCSFTWWLCHMVPSLLSVHTH